MRIVVVGGSRFGAATVRQLLEAGHEVVLVDRDRGRLDDLAEELDCGLVCGDGTFPGTLRDAYGDGADALMLLTNHDDVNILAAVVGRSVGFERIVMQIVAPEHLAMTDELALGDVITPHETVARSIVRALQDKGDVESDMRLHRGLRIVTYNVPDRMDGTTLRDVDLPEDTRTIARIRGEDETLVTGDETLRAGDKVMIAVAQSSQDDLDAVFRGD